MVEVTQADREAYLAMNMLPEFDAADVRAGRWDNLSGVQSFAQHRTNALRSLADDPAMVERAARAIAPHLEGGREFDMTPPSRIELRSWVRQGMCLTNDATQDDAMEVAQAVLRAIGGVE